MKHTTPSMVKTGLHVADSLLCCFVFFPSMVLYWRGAWDLWGVYIFPDQHPVQEWILLAISATSVFGYFFAPLLERALNRNNKIVYFVLSRGYMFLYAAFSMCFWRALWYLADYYLAYDLVSSLLQFGWFYIPMLVLKTSKTCIGPPLYTSLDTREDFLTVTTRFGTKPFTVKYAADAVFSHFIIMGLTILSWRAMWNILGSINFPDDVHTSDLFCFGLGYALAVLVFLLEELLALLTLRIEKYGFYYKLIWEDVVFTLLFISNSILWRGAWHLTSTYIFPDFEIGGWFCFIVGTILLMSLQLFSFVSAHGISIDGIDEGRGAFFPTNYLRVYLKKKEVHTEEHKAIAEESSCEETVTSDTAST